MSFKTLEDRFNEKVNSLYSAATMKFDNGKPSKGANDDPLIVRKPGKGYWNKAESRSTPISSTLNDVKRLTLFTLSVRGVSFLAKQQILQTGNTFESTRIINPLFVVGNAVPFVHAKRALDIPITARGIGRQLLGGGALADKLFGSGGQKSDIGSLRKIGQLQQETYNKYANNSPTITSLLKKIPVIGQTISAVKAKRSMGEVGDGWKNSRPELGMNDSGYFMYGKITDWNKNKQQVASNISNSLKTIFVASPNVKALDLVKYGPLKNNGKYVTYLKLGSDQNSWTRPRNVTDYTKYIAKNYKQAVAARYSASVEELSQTARELLLETALYKKSQSEKELDKKIQEYPKTHFVVKAFESLSSIGKIRPEIGETDKEYFPANLSRFKFGGTVSTESFKKNKYGTILTGNTWNGTYKTYLVLGHNQRNWGPQLTTSDYKNYTQKFYKQVSNQKYEAVGERLSAVGLENLLETRLYKKSSIEKELDKRVKDYEVTRSIKIQVQKYKKSAAETKLDKKIIKFVDTDVALSDAEREKPRPEVLASGAPIPATYSGKQFIKYFSAGNVGISSVNASEIVDGKTTNMKERLEAFKSGSGAGKKLSYIKDESNLPPAVPNLRVPMIPYQSINNHFDDPIVVSFAMGNGGHVRFRAYMKDLTEAVNPQYTPYQYIGRIEKFINYTGVQREISFKLGVLAFSKDELDGVWRKINYLTGMAFPYGFTGGIMQPNIVRLTIGNVYVNQPGYISSMNKNFNDHAESWELDSGKQVPIGASVDIKFTLIEKATKIAESPFYGITEEMEGFSKTLDVPEPLTQNTTEIPSNTSTPVPTGTGPRSNVPANPNILGERFGGFNTGVGVTAPTNTGPFRGFGGGGGFSGGGGGSSFG